MNYLKMLSQQKILTILAIYVGFFLNLSVFIRRIHDVTFTSPFLRGLALLTEVATCMLATYFIFRLLLIGGKWFWRIVSSVFVLICVAASFYMTVFNTVIGYGIVISVLTAEADPDLSREAVGWHFLYWMIAVSLVPLILIWLSPGRLQHKAANARQRLRAWGVLVVIGLLIWLPLRQLSVVQKADEHVTNIDMPSYGGVVALSYLPSNWISGVGLYLYSRLTENKDDSALADPAKMFHWVAPDDLDDTYVVFVIGETSRWDHMGLLGYGRDTTPQLAKEKNLVAFRGISCDTATKLSLRCMFVRKGGTENNPQRTLKEKNVFSVLKSLGFTSELFAMQSEVWFYNRTNVDNFAFRETIASEVENEGKSVDDMLLIPKLAESLQRYPKGKHLVILHTKGSHYLYSQRYPRSFAFYQPECMGVDESCSKEQLINAYDNSIRYVDEVLEQVINQVRDKKAIVFYASDHGESMDDDVHFHGTPREIAPDEQFRVPLMVWMSDKFLQNPTHRAAYEQLRKEQHDGVQHYHTDLFDSILGCIGFQSPDGGINPQRNWCQLPAAVQGQ